MRLHLELSTWPSCNSPDLKTVCYFAPITYHKPIRRQKERTQSKMLKPSNDDSLRAIWSPATVTQHYRLSTEFFKTLENDRLPPIRRVHQGPRELFQHPKVEHSFAILMLKCENDSSVPLYKRRPHRSNGQPRVEKNLSSNTLLSANAKEFVPKLAVPQIPEQKSIRSHSRKASQPQPKFPMDIRHANTRCPKSVPPAMFQQFSYRGSKNLTWLNILVEEFESQSTVRWSRQRQPQGNCGRFCSFCFRNGYPLLACRTHLMRNPLTKEIICPILLENICDLCGDVGDIVHVAEACPEGAKFRQAGF